MSIALSSPSPLAALAGDGSELTEAFSNALAEEQSQAR
jgi:hypothetical protein